MPSLSTHDVRDNSSAADTSKSHQGDALRQIPGDVLAVPSWIPGARKQQAYRRVADDEAGAVDPDDHPFDSCFDKKADGDDELPE